MPLIKLWLVFPQTWTCEHESMQSGRYQVGKHFFFPPYSLFLDCICSEHSQGEFETVGNHTSLRSLVVWADDVLLRGQSSGTQGSSVQLICAAHSVLRQSLTRKRQRDTFVFFWYFFFNIAHCYLIWSFVLAWMVAKLLPGPLMPYLNHF